MKRIVWSTVLCAAFLWSEGRLSHAASGIQDGLWEMTMETQMEGLPMAMPPVSSNTRQCITPGDAVPRNDGSMKNCTVKNQKVSGNKASWEFECSDDQGKAVGKGEMTYSGTSCSGVSRTAITSKEGDKMTATTRIKGRRVGACPPGGVAATGPGESPKIQELRDKSARVQGQQDAATGRALELTKIKVPRTPGDACVYLSNGVVNPDCAGRGGQLNLKEGEWNIREEVASISGGTVLPAASSQGEKMCLSPEKPVPGDYLSRGCDPVELKRSGATVTWKLSCTTGMAKVEGEGGIEYRGDSFTGALVLRNTTVPDAPLTTYSRLTGTRTGDGACVGQANADKNQPGAPPATDDQTEEIVKNPVKKLKSLFGF